MATQRALDRDSGKTLRAVPILDALSTHFGDTAVIALDYRNTWELLIATMLSAQTTDVAVNLVTPVLFGRWPGPAELAEAPLPEVESAIGSIGLFRQKARNAQGTARILLAEHGGEVPDTMEALIALPGVARKTANVVLSNAFGTNAGVVVDTHVQRISRRLGLTREETPPKIERDLMRLFPQERWLEVADTFIHHGRSACDARRPRCDDCVIETLCPSSKLENRRDRGPVPGAAKTARRR